jgi:hypothetical protein
MIGEAEVAVHMPMNVIVQGGLRACGCLIGALLVYAGLFLYEDDQKRLQNRLEELWIHIDDMSRDAESTFAGFTMEVSRIAEQVFARVFGGRVMSWRAVAISSCFAIASLDLSLMSSSDGQGRRAEVEVATLCIVLGAMPALINRGWATAIAIGAWIFMVSQIPLYAFANFHKDAVDVETRVVAALSITIAPPLMDLMWIYGCRVLLKSAASARAASAIVIWNLTTLMCCLLPQTRQYNMHELTTPIWLAVLISTFARTRWFLALGASVLLSLAAVAILHLYTWPVLARLVYPLQRFDLFSRPKTLIGIGVALFALSSGAMKWLEFLLKVGG